MNKVSIRDVEILTLLKESTGFLSGEEISKELQVTRNSVWKHIESLRARGYEIESNKPKGYLLKNINFKPFTGTELSLSLQGIKKAGNFGKNIYFSEEIGSTNAKAFDLAKKGEEEGTIVIANKQTDGKGRLQRKWHSPTGKNLYLSIILKPQIETQKSFFLTYLASISLAEVLMNYTNTSPQIKWPNDILFNGKKISGILTEMKTEGNMLDFLVLGIGVNLNTDIKDLNPEIKDIATSLKILSKKETDRLEFTTKLLQSLKKWYDNFLNFGEEKIIKEYKKYFLSEGKMVSVSETGLQGICMGLSERGAILIRDNNGDTHEVFAGDIITKE